MRKKSPSFACFLGHRPVVQYLLEKGANIEAKDKDQETPLHTASEWCRADVAKYLLSKGANKHAKNKDGRIPRDVVCKRSYNFQMDFLIELLR